MIATGDYNTSKFSDYASTYLPAMTSNGYGDTMNQAYRTPKTPRRAEWCRRTWVNSFNGFRRNAAVYSYATNRAKTGNGIDWVFASNYLRVRESAVVMNLRESTMRLTGVIPSDHSMVRATVVLP